MVQGAVIDAADPASGRLDLKFIRLEIRRGYKIQTQVGGTAL